MGVFEKESAGVNISEADSIIVSHNTIHTSPRSGINVNCGCFGGHIIEFNDVWGHGAGNERPRAVQFLGARPLLVLSQNQRRRRRRRRHAKNGLTR
jgi:hypothetical protein